MSLVFFLLKFFKVWETPYDSVILLGLIQGDIVALNALHHFLRRLRRRW